MNQEENSGDQIDQNRLDSHRIYVDNDNSSSSSASAPKADSI